MNMNIMQMLQMIQGGTNPQAALQMLMQRNPQIAQTMQQIQNSSGGSDPRTIAMQLGKQKGIPEQQIMQMYNQFHR